MLRVVVKSGQPSKGPYTELAGLAQALGVAHRGASQLEAEVNGLHLVCSVGTNSGVVDSVIACVTFAETYAAKLKLRAETEEDRQAKAEAVNVEVQLREPRFDDAIYVDSDAPDEEVQRVLGDVAVREAVLALVRGGAVLQFEGAHLTATWEYPKFKSATEGDQARAALEAFMVVAARGGLAGPTTTRHGQWLVWLLTLAILPTISLLVWNGEPGSWWLAVGGAVTGLVSSALLKRPLRWVMAGDSGSAERATLALGLCVLLGAGLGFGVPTWLNQNLDTEAGVVLEGVVEAIDQPDGDSSGAVHVRWSDGSTDTWSFRRSYRVGQSVKTSKRPGALGFSWRRSR